MKVHIGINSRTRLIYLVVATAANFLDSQVLEDLLHGEVQRLGNTGQKETLSEHAPHAKGFTQKKAFRNKQLTEEDKSSIRSRVEQFFM